MGLFDSIFRPNREQQNAVRSEFFKTLTPYKPVFHSWQGSIYESELIRAAIYARARHISKLKFSATGSAKVGLVAKLNQGPNQWQTWPQFLASFEDGFITSFPGNPFSFRFNDQDLTFVHFISYSVVITLTLPCTLFILYVCSLSELLEGRNSF